MNNKQNSLLFILGGVAGVIATASYILIVTIPLPDAVAYFMAMLWPILSVFFGFAVYKYIALNKQTVSNQLSFLFGCIAFTLVSIMLSVQLGVKAGMAEEIAAADADKKGILELILYSLRWVDLGIDLAWDMFLGVSLIFTGFAFKSHPKIGIWWCIPAILFGVLVLGLNLYTFPNPPNTQGILDIGPFVGTFMTIFAARFIFLGVKFKASAKAIT